MQTKLRLMALVLGCGLVFSGCRKQAEPQSSPAPTQKPRKSDKNVNQEPVEARPFVQLLLAEDGRTVVMKIVELKKQAADLEYEIEYSAGELLQGAFGNIDTLTRLPVTKDVLLGTRSAGGKTTYHTNVTGGTLTLRFGNPDYTMKQEWSYTDKALKAASLSSRDAKFVVTLPKTGNKVTHAVIYNSPGYPGKLEGTVIAGPYSISTIGTLTGAVPVSIRLPAGQTTGTIVSFDGKAWVEQKTTIKDNVAQTTGTLGQVYVVISE